MVQFYLGGLVRQLRVPKFGVALGLYTEEFMDGKDLSELHRHIYYSPSTCWRALVPVSATYDPSRSKAIALSPSLRYLHAILVHTLTGRRESTGVVNTHDAYFFMEHDARARLRPCLLHRPRYSTSDRVT
ncbi:hypothetical protein J1N35_000832 [Gossypium stocksii]|uniref:Uncharacterized protein n=1 Tax=Gossypium stocksii TaxID=47602 RepID=A0A9D4ALD7_9ROSI|nr:hypothetical protein J1N35_000832 [Gossypium stocksii]